MRQPHVNDFVRLTREIPELDLDRGQVGIVRWEWHAPSVAYEVEFAQSNHRCQTRALLQRGQCELDDGPIASELLVG